MEYYRKVRNILIKRSNQFKIFSFGRYNTIHISNWSSEVVDVIENYQKQVIVEAQLGYDGKDIPGKDDKKFTFI